VSAPELEHDQLSRRPLLDPVPRSLMDRVTYWVLETPGKFPRLFIAKYDPARGWFIVMAAQGLNVPLADSGIAARGELSGTMRVGPLALSDPTPAGPGA
jgi:hypothetical protein